MVAAASCAADWGTRARAFLPQGVDAAALPARPVQDRRDGALEALVGVADHELELRAA